MIFSFGSTIGNLNGEGTPTFLQAAASSMAAEDRFLIGLDIVRPVKVLEAACHVYQFLH